MHLGDTYRLFYCFVNQISCDVPSMQEEHVLTVNLVVKQWALLTRVQLLLRSLRPDNGLVLGFVREGSVPFQMFSSMRIISHYFCGCCPITARCITITITDFPLSSLQCSAKEVELPQGRAPWFHVGHNRGLCKFPSNGTHQRQNCEGRERRVKGGGAADVCLG